MAMATAIAVTLDERAVGAPLTSSTTYTGSLVGGDVVVGGEAAGGGLTTGGGDGGGVDQSRRFTLTQTRVRST